MIIKKNASHIHPLSALVLLLAMMIAETTGSRCFANAYYISNEGNDANSGTNENESWQTIAKINAAVYLPGDSILFKGGESFTGGIRLINNGKGTPGYPLTFASYGVGKATISSVLEEGMYIEDAGNIVIKNLVFRGAGYMQVSMWGAGVDFWFSKTASSNSDNIVLDSIECLGYGGNGLQFGSFSPDYGFNHVSVTNSLFHDNGMGGIQINGYWDSLAKSTKMLHSDIYLGHCKTYNNKGRLDYLANWSGCGILMGGVTGGVIEFCEAYENGAENGSTYAGPVGIFIGESKNILIQYSKSHNNYGGPGKRDGGGFDIDGGASYSTVQFCESYENEGAGYGLYNWQTNNPWTNDTIRNNTSVNDGRNSNIYGGITLWSVNNTYKLVNGAVYNNKITLNVTGTGLKFLSNSFSNMNIHDNEFCLTSPAIYTNGIVSTATVTNSTFPCSILPLINRSFKVIRIR